MSATSEVAYLARALKAPRVAALAASPTVGQPGSRRPTSPR